MAHPIEILEQYWNFTSFKPQQENIINSVLNGDDCFALLPTSGGKSLCFQIPALAKEGICIVISPLIALMKDQVEALSEKGIKAIALTSEYSYKDIDIMLDNCIYGNYKFLYLSPERLQQEIVQERIRQMDVNLIAVDEAHCISQWGNDFRPAYKNISVLRELHPSVNVLALTASATKTVVDDIILELDLMQPKIFKQSFRREHLAYMVFEEEDKNYRIEHILNKHQGASIIYVRNRKNTIQLSNYLIKKGITSSHYHGGLSPLEKSKNFLQWKNNQKQVMVATSAFGMGIDKPDVKTVIHINLPESIESYFQEAGRAGRNNQKAFSIILKNKGDELHVKQQFLSVLPKVEFIKELYRKLCNYFQISYGEGEFSTHDFNFGLFCKTYLFNPMIAFNALQLLDRTSIIKLSQQYQNRSEVQIIMKNDFLFEYMNKHQGSRNIIKAILRTYGGIFDFQTKINTTLVADKAASNEDTVIATLVQLEKDGVISLKLKTTDAQITFLVPREDDKTINRISKIVEQQNDLKKRHVKAVITYINNDKVCKNVQLLNYFGEEKVETCGICSVCIQENLDLEKDDLKSSMNIVKELLLQQPLSSRAIAEETKINEVRLTEILKLMLERQWVEVTSKNTYKLK